MENGLADPSVAEHVDRTAVGRCFDLQDLAGELDELIGPRFIRRAAAQVLRRTAVCTAARDDAGRLTVAARCDEQPCKQI